MDRIAVIFSGQGAQYARMGVRLKDYHEGEKTFQEANDALGMDIASICCDGTDEELARTEITQPAIVTCSIAVFRILKSGLENTDSEIMIRITGSDPALVSATAGLSVGEYSALVASEVLSFADALNLVKERGRLMAEASQANPGIMVAVLGLEADVVKMVCDEASSYGIVQLANFNCPGQIVISGEKKAVQIAVELAQKAGAKKCVALDVSGAFHSPLMRSAELGLRKVLNRATFSKPKIPFVANFSGNYADDPERIREMLTLQLSNPIQWESSVRRIVADGTNNFVEVGPGKVLAGLVRRIYREAKVFSSEDILEVSG